MAKFGPFKNGLIKVNAVNLSDHCTEFSVEKRAAELPDHTHGDETAIVTLGLFDWTIQGTFLQDFAAAKVNATLRPLLDNRTRHGVECQGDAGSVSAANPKWSGTAVLVSYRPLGGPHGDNLQALATFRPAGDLNYSES